MLKLKSEPGCYNTFMKILIVGASGYLGSEIFAYAKKSVHEVVGTSRSGTSGLLRFDLEDKSTWNTLTDQRADVLIWASRPSAEEQDSAFSVLLNLLQCPKTVYISSDVILCKKTLARDTELGKYARSKLAEQQVIEGLSNSAIYIVGPIFGRNSLGILDRRTQKLLDESATGTYWNNAYKTYVPVDGLAKTICSNLETSGVHYAGPANRLSYFEFNYQRARECGLPTDKLQSVDISQDELARLGLCFDTSYARHPDRIWFE